jgi:nucleotide-binding universal stress UspA family protein
MVASHFHSDSALRRWITEDDADERAWVGRLIEEAAKKLRNRGLTVTHLQSDKSPKSVLLEESEKWKADCIFVGARGLSGLKHFLIGSVSAAVAARAHCTVEVVRDRS